MTEGLNEVLSECWLIALSILAVAIIVLMIWRGVTIHIEMGRRRAELAETTPAEVPQEVREASRKVGNEALRLKVGLQRITDSPDPLQALVDAISASQGRRTER